EDDAITNKYGGTGLGLAITKNIVDIMNGTISVRSEKGRGSEFTVNITFRKAEHTEKTSSNIHPEEMHVLIIDDDQIACDHAKLVLEEVGITSDTALGPEEALERVRLSHARRESYNMILVDLKMPEKNGVVLSRELREIVGEEPAIIILTAYSWDDIADAAHDAGIDSFMSKPLYPNVVLDEFERILKHKKHVAKDRVQKADLNGKRVLMAEDMFINAEIMKQILAMRNLEVEHAQNGQIAVDMFRESPEHYYDAVLMDIRMPVLDGLQATEAIRALDRPDAKTTPIIAMTANAFDEDVQRSLQVGMNAHLSKPVEPEHLYETLELLMGDRG
ncbi:MAG: response regulator, partial [Lachnospiraceae bacterium]|nr:response regulator [Lachnospiraceae bacterium]